MNQPNSTVARPAAHAAPSLSLGDLQFIFFRHKWLILAVFIIGLGAAVGIYFLMPPTYRSESRVLVSFVSETTGESLLTDPSEKVRQVDPRGESIILTEVDILTSRDLAQQVANTVGPEKVLAAFGGGDNPVAAAAVVQAGLSAESPRRSSVIRIQYEHKDPLMTHTILSKLVEAYLQRHVEIHQRPGQSEDWVAKEADQLRTRIAQADEDIKKLLGEANVISVEDSKRACVEQTASIRTELMTTEAELAGRKATLNELTRQSDRPVTTENTNTATAAAPAVLEKYRLTLAEGDVLRKREQDLTLRYASEHPLVRQIRQLMADCDTRRKQMEETNPALLSVSLPRTDAPGAANDFSVQTARVLEMEARLKVLTNHLAMVQEDATRLRDVGPLIIERQRKRDADIAQLERYNTRLQQKRLDETLGAGKVTGISVIQTPSPPARDINAIQKPMAAAVAFGLFGGLALAFLLEKFLSQSIKRPADLEKSLNIPMLLTVPDMAWKKRSLFRRSSNGRVATVTTDAPLTDVAASRKSADGVAASRESADGVAGPLVKVNRNATELAPWDPNHELHEYHDALRDRLMNYFEIRNMTHKPKLVAVTSCRHGAGVTSMASGLAASLSETGDGNVLLVDMNLDQGGAQAFHKGKPATGLSEFLDSSKQDQENAMVNDNLYLVSVHEGNSQKLPRVLPKRFASLVPKMKASDYDYIIFDMPPVSQTSLTPRLSSLMDMVVMVVESEKTGQEVAKQATALLHEHKANVTAVLNKNRNYVPERLRQEL